MHELLSRERFRRVSPAGAVVRSHPGDRRAFLGFIGKAIGFVGRTLGVLPDTPGPVRIEVVSATPGPGMATPGPGPFGLPSWALPAAIGVVALIVVLFFVMRRR